MTVDRRYGFPRRRSYVEGPDVLAAARWEVNEPLRWTDVDRLDPQRDDLNLTFADFQYAEVRTRVASGDLWQRSATQNLGALCFSVVR